MAQFIKEVIVTKNMTPAESTETAPENAASNSQRTEYLIYFFFGVLEFLLGFRFVLKLAGASLSSGFVRGLYGITGIFIMPFEGIFRRGLSPGLETTSVWEPSTIVALLVFAMVAWGIVRLVRIGSGEKQSE